MTPAQQRDDNHNHCFHPMYEQPKDTPEGFVTQLCCCCDVRRIVHPDNATKRN